MSKFCQYGDMVGDIVKKTGLDDISVAVNGLSDYVKKSDLSTETDLIA